MALITLARAVSLLWLLPLLTVIWIAGVIVYRLYFHPLAHIPGSRLAAVTYLYSFYFNSIAPGSQFFAQIEKLHEIYGMIL
jgi:cytochrome b subunit of formate dehydrogenase